MMKKIRKADMSVEDIGIRFFCRIRYEHLRDLRLLGDQGTPAEMIDALLKEYFEKNGRPVLPKRRYPDER